MQWIESLILGVVQGLTEFLPVSSDGHLNLTQALFDAWRGTQSTGAARLFFDVMLHLGTTAAIIAHYRKVVHAGARGLLGASDVPELYQRPRLIRTGLLACVATLPLVPYALVFRKLVEKTFEGLTVTGIGFFVTALILLVTLRLQGGQKGPREMTWLDAVLIGLAQVFAPLPGVSRSGLTIAAGLALGLSRSWAVGFSLMIAVPAVLGATVFELKKADPSTLTPEYVARILAGAGVAGLVGYAAIVWLVRIVRAGRLWYFSVYLIILAAAVLALASRLGG